MNRLIFLNELTKKQRYVADANSKVVEMPRGSGKTSTCFAAAVSYCKENKSINIAIVTKYLTTYKELVENLKRIEVLDIIENKNGFIVNFKNTKSCLVISKFRNESILNPNNNLVNYRYNFFTYTIIYFDDIKPCDVIIKDSYKNYDTLEFLDCCVKDKFVFVYSE